MRMNKCAVTELEGSQVSHQPQLLAFIILSIPLHYIFCNALFGTFVRCPIES